MGNERFMNFYRRLRHLLRTNLCVTRYAFKSLVCILRGDSKDLYFVRINELANSSTVKDLPLSVIEYEFCIAYAKLIRKTLIYSDDSSCKMQFETVNLFGLIENDYTETLKNIFVFIAESCGFSVEKCCNGKIYEITSHI